MIRNKLFRTDCFHPDMIPVKTLQIYKKNFNLQFFFEYLTLPALYHISSQASTETPLFLNLKSEYTPVRTQSGYVLLSPPWKY